MPPRTTYGIGGLMNMYGGGQQAGSQGTTFDTDLHKESWLPPEEQGQSEKFDWQSMMKEQPPGLTMRNTEPFIDPITGKPEEYVPNKPAEEAPKTPNTAGTQKAQMFGQFGDPKKAMGSVWDQIKGVGGGIKKGLGALDAKMEQNYKDMGYGTEDKSTAPWSVKDIPKENWENWEMGILANPDTEGNEESLMKMAMGDDGQLDQGRWNMIKDHIGGSKENPYYKMQRNKQDAINNPLKSNVAKGYKVGYFR